jgi:tetrapyrrole methylase family protein/MazG family protein
LLKRVDHVFLRTKEHPVVEALVAEDFKYTSFDEVYERHDSFEVVYTEIVQILLEANKQGDIVYAVPGHPMIAERTVQLLIESDIEIEIKGGQSFLDDMFTSLKIDPIEGFQFFDATDFDPVNFSLQQHIVFCQVYNSDMASNVKLALLEILPYDYEVFIVRAAGTDEEVITKVALCELDHVTTLNNLTSVYVPPASKELLRQEFSSLRETIRILRGPNGCPWDKKQTHQSLKKNLIEETQELLEALDEEDDEHIIEELGDVLLQIMLHAQIGEDEGWFNMDDIICGLNEKLIRRHPHVFGDIKVKSPEEAIAIWNEMKKNERG